MELMGPVEIINLTDAKDYPHGIPGRHRRQQGLVPGNQVARRHLLLADNAINRGADFGEFQV